MTRIYLIRHAKPSSTWGGADDDPGLDETRREQARRTAERLLALPPSQRPASIATSPLRRCRETAGPLAEALGLAPAIDAAVGEIPTPSGLEASARPAWLRASLGGEWAAIVGDIDYQAWREAVAAAVAARPGAAIFSHFVAINAVVSLLAGDEQVVRFRPDHGSVTVLDGAETGLRLVELGAEASTGVL